MIFYFTGTGNSLFAADTISKAQGEKLVSIASEMDRQNYEYTLRENELIGFVYPIYAWGPPQMVMEFVRKLKLTGGKPYIFTLCTCGDEEGNSTNRLKKALAEKGLQLNSAFSLIMTNNYIVGFDVDPGELEQKKLKAAEQRLQKINSILTQRQGNVFELLPGKMAGIKSSVINPLFNRFGRSTKYFFATEKCTGCGICERVCPIHTIRVKGKPEWGNACTQCLACIHRCPVHAIQYTKGTAKKGRYVHPSIK